MEGAQNEAPPLPSDEETSTFHILFVFLLSFLVTSLFLNSNKKLAVGGLVGLVALYLVSSLPFLGFLNLLLPPLKFPTDFSLFEWVYWMALVELVLISLSYSFEKVSNVVYKQEVFLAGVIGMVRSRDFHWRDPPKPALLRDVEKKQTKRIVFIRHGESEWNEIFNRGFGIGFFFRLIRGFIRELLLITTRDSIFVDSSLSEEGMEQIEELHYFLRERKNDGQNTDVVSLLRGDEGVDDSVILSSNLRRAIATAALGLRHRLANTKEQVYIHSALQEVSRNIDANSISRPSEVPDLHVIQERLEDDKVDYNEVFNASLNGGQKVLLKTNGLKRMKEFNRWIFNQSKNSVIVGGGHSFYFRAFFRCFLDAEDEHIAKKYIMKNGAVVAFDLEYAVVDGKDRFRIPLDSVKEVFSGHLDSTGSFKVPQKKA